MPPKKRNRDVDVKPEPDPDQLDKDELKGMLRQSLDEKAELVAQMDQQKAELEAKMEEQRREFEAEKAEVEAKNGEQKKEIDQLFMHRIFLHFCPDTEGTPNGEVRRAFYPNCRVVQQAEAAGTIKRLNLAVAVHSASMKVIESFVYHYPVKTCTELVDIFENGLKAGSVLKKEHQDDSSLFSLIIVTNSTNATTVPAGREDQYRVVAARSAVKRYNPLLAAYLDQDFMYQQNPRRAYNVLFHSQAHVKYDQDIQDRVQRLENNEYSTVLKGVWVIDNPDADGAERAHRADLDFDRMVETVVGSGKQVGMGFWV